MSQFRRLFPGSVIRRSLNIGTSAGAGADPDTVTYMLMSPNGETTTYVYGTDFELIRMDTGDYYVDVTPDIGGRWHDRWVTTGPDGAKEDSFIVTASPFIDDIGPRAYGR